MKHLLLLLFVWVTFVGGAAGQDCSTIEIQISPVSCKGSATGVAEAPILANVEKYSWSIISLDNTYDPEFELQDITNYKQENLVPGKYEVIIQFTNQTSCTKLITITEPKDELAFSSAEGAASSTNMI
jgi:hypothetical protein